MNDATTSPRYPSLSADGQYYVLPEAVLSQLPAVVQQQVAVALAEIHRHDQQTWPVYQVVPSRWVRLGDLDETQLRQHDVIVELDLAGEMTYRYRSTGRRLTMNELDRPVLAPLTL